MLGFLNNVKCDDSNKKLICEVYLRILIFI